ncbi:MAG: YceI family protein [Flavobacteriaceae bacterium]|nr:YceI family protein [Flavobacteriaceae bacterium]
MRKVIVLLSVVFLFLSCKDKAVKKEFCVDENTLTVKWTAYKTTEKIPVSGKFEKIIIQKSEYGKSAVDAVNNVEFSISVSSIFTNNTERDEKLKKFFFGMMKDTERIEGTVSLQENNEGTLHLTMNGVTASLPIQYKVKDQLVTIEGVLNLDTWKGKLAIEALNKACEDLHKGPDGVSKTWNEVKVEAGIYVKFHKE